MATFEEFMQIDMRVGRVVSVDDFPEARNAAWKLEIDFGPEVGVKRSSGPDQALPARGAGGAARGGRRQLPAAPDKPRSTRRCWCSAPSTPRRAWCCLRPDEDVEPGDRVG